MHSTIYNILSPNIYPCQPHIITLNSVKVYRLMNHVNVSKTDSLFECVKHNLYAHTSFNQNSNETRINKIECLPV